MESCCDVFLGLSWRGQHAILFKRPYPNHCKVLTVMYITVVQFRIHPASPQNITPIRHLTSISCFPELSLKFDLLVAWVLHLLVALVALLACPASRPSRLSGVTRFTGPPCRNLLFPPL